MQLGRSSNIYTLNFRVHFVPLVTSDSMSLLLGHDGTGAKSTARGDLPNKEVICMLTTGDDRHVGSYMAIRRLGSA